MNSGKLVILAILLVAVSMAGYAVWHQYQIGSRTHAFFGTETAQLIRHAPHVALLVFSRESSTRPPPPMLEIGSDRVFLVRQRNLSGARGLVHARDALIKDASYDWQSTPAPCQPQWPFGLRFSDGQSQVTLAVDPECHQLYWVEGRKSLAMQETDLRLSEYLDPYLRELPP